MNVTDYPLAVMHHYEMGIEGLLGFLRQVAKGDVDKIKGIEGVSKNRRALLPYGATVLLEIIAAMKPSKIVVSALGVREGFLYSLLSAAGAAGRPADLRVGGTGAAARPLGHPRARAGRTGPATRFAAFGIDETEDEVRYRRAACLLADIGWRAHPEYRGTQSLNIIAHASFIGVDHPGRAFLALTNYFRHEGVFNEVERRRRSPGWRHAALSGARPTARRDDARRLPVVGVDAGRHAEAQMGKPRTGGGLALVVPRHSATWRASVRRGG